jgi:hypothetical protein
VPPGLARGANLGLRAPHTHKKRAKKSTRTRPGERATDRRRRTQSPRDNRASLSEKKKERGTSGSTSKQTPRQGQQL